jgi:YjbE family integral membrane protein
MLDLISPTEIAALLQVIAIDVALAGDNAIVVGMAAAGLPKSQRARAILIGIIAATLMRIGFAAFTTQLLQIVGLMLAGGILLLWVSWKLWREIRSESRKREETAAADLAGTPHSETAAPEKTFRQAVTQIVVADISMSLDNVLAVAGAARDHMWVLIIGLTLSVALMGMASTFIARLLQKHHWIAYVGLAVIFYVALHMIWDGSQEIMALTAAAPHAS